jgi:hypothetical protein
VTTAYRTVTEFTATAGQTSFSVPSYTVGYIDVFRNGVRLGSTDYTATTGTTVVLASGAIVGDLVVTESFYVSSVLNAIPATAGAVNSTYIANGVTLTSPTLTSPVIAGTPSGVGTLTSATAVLASGTSIDFTSIPSWVKRITVMFNASGTNGTSLVQVQLGSGSVANTGYVSYASSAAGNASSTTGFVTTYALNPGQYVAGIMTICLVSGFSYVASGSTGLGAVNAGSTWGTKTLSGVLDRVRITTVNGTDVFNSGSINIMYE